ncbi:GNAT family N-acetyltransferase [Candidatus Bathyarchaeota archaeon]|nr:GNAT family N-acetyltransferase [Candidatus Bathyarchaeota archaeon]
MIIIRGARPDDESKIFALFENLVSRQRTDEYRVNQKTGVATYRQIIGEPTLGVILVAEEEAELIGSITLSYPVSIRCSGPYARIEEFIVSEASRGRGVGSRLLEAAIDEAKKMGCHDLQVNNPSDLGQPLYINHDFQNGGDYMRLKL